MRGQIKEALEDCGLHDLVLKVMYLLGGIAAILPNIIFASVWIGLLQMVNGGSDS